MLGRHELMLSQRRTTKYTPVPPKSTVKPTAAAAGAQKEEGQKAARRGSASEDNTSGRSTPQPVAAVGSLKRSNSKTNLKKDKSVGDLFKSFAKAKPKAKEAEKSKESTPAAEDGMFNVLLNRTLLTFVEPMQGMSEDEGDADDEPENTIDKEKAEEAARKARAEREARNKELKEMMEADGKPRVYNVSSAAV